jgi:Domain of unknown function (DUF4845)
MLHRPMKSRQRGVSFLGLMFWGITIACGGVLLAQVAPTVLEYQTILKACNKAKEGTTVQEVKTIFTRATEIDHIKSITANDLDISKGAGDKVIVRFSYQNEIHLFGPAFLTLKYAGETK